jgi:stage V sporulation protein G
MTPKTIEKQKQRVRNSDLTVYSSLIDMIKDSTMKITEVKIFSVNEERLKAYVTITIEGCFVVRDLKIIQGPGGLFVAMPSKKRKDGQFRDIAHPLNQETREKLEDQIFEAYENELRSMGATLVNLKRQKAPQSYQGDD